jgi:hypothetical protein
MKSEGSSGATTAPRLAPRPDRPWRVRIAFVRGPDAEEVELIEELDG